MPNHKLPSSITTDMKHNIELLARKPGRALAIQFPLVADEVQNMLLDPETLQMCKTLHAGKISGVDQTTCTNVLIRRAMVPDGWRPIQRDAAIQVNNLRVFYPKHTSYSTYVPNFDASRLGKDNYNPALIENMGQEAWDKLSKWIDYSVNARRREQLALWFADEMLNGLTDTTTLHMLWPLLATFCKEHRWTNRINEVSNRKTPYMPDFRKVECARKYKAAVEEILADASLTEMASLDSKKHALVIAWEFKDGDWNPSKGV